MSGEDDETAMRARLANLSQDLAKGRGVSQPASKASESSTSSALNLGARVASELVACVAVGGFIGWMIDRWAHSSPIGLIVFIILGTAAGFYGVYRIATKTGGR